MAAGFLEKIHGSVLRVKPWQLAGINSFPIARNRLEIQLVACDLHQHKTLVCIKAFHALPRLAKVVRHQLAGLPRTK